MRASGRRLLLAFVAGVASLLPWSALVDKHVAIGSAFVAAYYFVAQFLLSRGRPRAYVTDWATMLALDASALLLGLALVGRSPHECIPMLYCTVGGTYAGAVAASLGARSRWPVLLGSAALPKLLVVSAGALVGGFAAGPFFGVLGLLLERSVGCSPRWADPGVSAGCATLGWAVDSVGAALGMGVGAYLADRRQGRLALVLACALVIVSAGQAAWALTGRVLAESVRGNLMALWVVAQVVAVALVERATARRRSADAPPLPVSGKARWLGVGHGGWLVLTVLLCLGRPPLNAQGVVVGEGDRVRVWLGPAMVPPGQTGPSLKGRLLAIAGDTLELNTGHSSMTLRRDAVVRIDRSIGRPHAWRNARYAFYGTLALGSVLNVAVSRTCVDFFPAACFAVFTVGLVLPASGLAALIAGVSAREQFVPARLPPPGAVTAAQASWAR